MQINVKGEMSIAEMRQALFEKLVEIESEFAVRHSRGATLYINPTNGFGEPVILRNALGREVTKLYTSGGYSSIAAEYHL